MDIIAICLVITAVLAYLNHRFVGLPTSIGVMSIALALSIVFIALDHFGFGLLRERVAPLLGSIDFSELLMQGMLSLLLFAGALHIDLHELRSFRWQIGLLALFGTALSSALIGLILWAVLPLLGLPISLGYALAFGALVSPTDPVAVMSILRAAGAPQSLEVVISGESLFNDGVGVVLFALVVTFLSQGAAPTVPGTALLLLQEAGGGLLFGAVLGYATFWLLKSIDSYQEEVLITLAAVVGGYALASHLHVSGPLAMVVVGVIIGNQGRSLAMSDVTRAHLDMFWELLDAILNAVLFVLLGLEILLISFPGQLLLPALAAILVSLVARFISVAAPMALFRRSFGLPRGSWQVLTWGGLRGGIAVALALSLPLGTERDHVLALTYAVVVFSILVQGTTIGRITRRALQPEKLV